MLPNVEDPDDLLRAPDGRPKPVGFGPIGRHWEPRVQYVGTYDDSWMAERLPLLPADFDERFHHAAPPDQILGGYVRGGEPVEIVGCSKEPLAFALPGLKAGVSVRFFLRDELLPLRCEMVVVDTRRMKLALLHRGVLPLKDDVLDIRSMTIDIEGGT